jgi:hypothetical protein
MADNTTTYKAVIETEVTGQGQVEQLNKTVDDTGEKFVSLRRQIRETTVELQSMADKGKDNTEEFRKLSEHLKELQVQQKKVAFEAKNTTDKLAELPGPLGNIGKGLKDAKESMEIFGKSTYVALGIVGLIIGAFVAMKEALSKTEEGQEALSKVSEAFGKVMAPIFALLEKVGIPLFEALATYLTWFAEKVTKVVEFLGITKSKVQEIATEGNKAFYDQAEKDLENMTKVQQIIKQQQEEAHRKAEEANKKHLEKIAEQERLAREAEKEALAKELADIEKIKEKMKGKTDPIGTDGLTVKEREAALKAEQDRKKYFADKTATLTASVEKKLSDGTIKIAQTTALEVEAIAKQNIDKRSKLEKFLSDQEQDAINRKLLGIKAGLNIAGTLIDKNTTAGKAIAVANTTIDTYQSAVAAYKSVVGIPIVGPALAPVAAAAAVAAGLLSVKQIVSTPIPQMSESGGGGADTSSSIPTPQVPTISAPNINVTGGQNPTSQIADTLSAASGKPIKAYVVSQDVSSQQALDRRTNRAATLTATY